MAQPQRSQEQQHIALLAFPFGSHDRTLLGLASKLACSADNVCFLFFSTRKSIDSLFTSASSPKLPENIRPSPVDLNGTQNDNENPVEEVDLFLKIAPKAFGEAVQFAFSQSGVKISCIISDVFLSYFVADMAKTLKVTWVALFVAVPHNLSAHLNTHLIRDFFRNKTSISSKEALDFIPGLSAIHASDLPEEILPRDSKETLLDCTLSNLAALLPQADAVVMNFYEELYPCPLLHDLKLKFSKLLNVGFLTQDLPPLDSKRTRQDCLSWLDRQEPHSVVYISFGTAATPPLNELLALAEALEESRLPFLWSLKDEKAQTLPHGFTQRTSLVGKVVSWAPQKEVLGHKSVGVFVTHCGANSMFESIASGVPMICRPLFADHMMNGRIVEEIWGIGVRVKGMVFQRKAVLKSLEIVLGHKQGREMRDKVLALKDTVRLQVLMGLVIMILSLCWQ